MLNRISILAAGAAVMALATTGANAAAFVAGSFAFNGATSTTTNVQTTTSFANSTGDITLPGSDTGSFTSISLPTSLATGNPYNFSTASGFNFTDAGLGSFAATSATLLGVSSGSGFASATWAVVGTYTIGSDFSNAGTILTADETISLTQTNGPGNSISISGTFQSPNAIGVPEPLTISLFGAGLAGLGFGSRRRKAATKA